jgi:hypothetical protein
MGSIKDIKQAVAKLTPEQRAKFRAWFEEFEARLFDEQIERDVKDGKLDKFAEEALRAHREGRTREL